MCSFTIFFTWLGFILMITAGSDELSLFSTTDTPDLDLLWNTDNTLNFDSPSDVPNDCISFDSGFARTVRAREPCGDLLSSPLDDGDLFNYEVPLFNSAELDGSYDSALPDSSLALTLPSDLLLSAGANCKPGDNPSRKKFRARNGEVCKDPPLTVREDRGWDKNLDWGIMRQGHPDYEWLRVLPFVPAENNDDYCPNVVVGRRYAVCGPNNEVLDTLGDGITLRNVHLCM